MEIITSCNDIHEVLSLSKADNISFINKDGVTYIVAHELKDVEFKSQVIKKTYGYGQPGGTLINRDILKLVPKNYEVTITESVIASEKRKIKYKPNDLVDKVMKVDNLLTTIPANELNHLLSCDYAMDKSYVRPVLNGICINKNEFAALDGFRLAVRKGNFEAKEQVIISSHIVPILKKIKYVGDVNIYYDDNYVKFQFGDLEVIGSRVQGDYIRYQSLITDDNRTSVEIETKPILDILKDYKKNKFEIVKLNFKENELIITSSNENASIEDKTFIKLQGESMEIAFNTNYLMDGLSNYENVTLELTSRVSPMLLKADDKLDLVLPVRFN